MVVYLYVWRAYMKYIFFRALLICVVISFSIIMYLSCHWLKVSRSDCRSCPVRFFRLFSITSTRSIITSLCISCISSGSFHMFSKYLLWRSWSIWIASGVTIYFPFISLLYDLIALLWHFHHWSIRQCARSCLVGSNTMIFWIISWPPSHSFMVWCLEGFDMCLPSLSCIICLSG